MPWRVEQRDLLALRLKHHGSRGDGDAWGIGEEGKGWVEVGGTGCERRVPQREGGGMTSGGSQWQQPEVHRLPLLRSFQAR